MYSSWYPVRRQYQKQVSYITESWVIICKIFVVDSVVDPDLDCTQLTWVSVRIRK